MGQDSQNEEGNRRNDTVSPNRRVCKFVSEMCIIVKNQKDQRCICWNYIKNPSYKDLVAFESLKEGKEFVYKITGYTLENEDDFVQGNKEEITNIYMKGLE